METTYWVQIGYKIKNLPVQNSVDFIFAME